MVASEMQNRQRNFMLVTELAIFSKYRLGR